MRDLPMAVTEEVADAISTGTPVVALESSIIAQGLPQPENIVTAVAAEGEIRNQGAIPATIAIIDGVIRIGLNPDEIEMLGSGIELPKAGRAELPLILTAGITAATSVSATMICSNLAGIRVFATGGIGGVHRNVVETYDISQDLLEFCHTQIVVVASGAKAVLDLRKTYEMLETLGVSVLAYELRELPAFWSRCSGIRSSIVVDAPVDFANSLAMRRQLGMGGGILAANPIPEESEIPLSQVEAWIDEALKQASLEDITGKHVTPYLLSCLAEMSEGETVRANMSLVHNNAKLAAQIATCFGKLDQ